MDRFGEDILVNSHWSPQQLAKVQAKMVERYPIVTREIDELVGKITEQVAVLSADRLLHRAWWEMVGDKIKSEQTDRDASISLRMIDYVQSIIVSATPPENKGTDVISEEAWTLLRSDVSSLFYKLNLDYQLCRTAYERERNGGIESGEEEFKFRAQLSWCNVRGSRYQIHDPVHLEDVFLPYSDLLVDLFGITAEQFISEFKKIWHSLSFGLGESMKELNSFREDALEALTAKMSAEEALNKVELRDLMAQVITENGWEDRQQRATGAFGMDIFDLRKISNLPQRLLDELSWMPGQETSFFEEGSKRGWPLRVWPVFLRPFIRLNDQYYCFDLYNLFDNLYRVVRRTIGRMRPDSGDVLNQIQSSLAERLAFQYFERLLPGAKTFRSVYYQWATGEHGARGWCETDGLIAYDDHLFIVEVRGGAFTWTSPATDFDGYVSSLKNLVLKPANQGRRFLEYLNSADEVPIFDQQHVQIDVLRRKEFRHITICPVTLDSFTEISAQVQHLRKMGLDVGATPTWVISIDDLRAYADIFESSLMFLHFVEQRLLAFGSTSIQADDELDHLGLYVKHVKYSEHADRIKNNSGAKLMFHGFRTDIDKFFRDRLQNPQTPNLLRQAMPARLSEIVTFLSKSSLPGRAKLSSYLLDVTDNWREQIAKRVEEEISRQPTSRRAKPFSMHGKCRLTIFCWVAPYVLPVEAQAIEHGYVVALLTNEPDRLVMELTYDHFESLVGVRWRLLSVSDLRQVDLDRLAPKVEKLRRDRLLNGKINGKIGVNEICPCGSGKKFKKCCRNREMFAARE